MTESVITEPTESPITEPHPTIDPEPEPEPEPPKIIYPTLSGISWYSDFRPQAANTITTTIGGQDFDRDFLAALLYCEAGSMGWTGQVYVCSAILNCCDILNKDLWTAGHTVSIFEVARYVDYYTPTEMQYQVIDYVLNGGRLIGVNYFRTNRYHSFGIPVCQIENVYFSK